MKPLAPVENQQLDLTIRPGPYSALNDAKARYFCECGDSHSDQLKVMILIGQQVVDPGNEDRVRAGTWVIHQVDLFKEISVNEMRNPREFKTDFKKRIDMQLESLNFGWKIRGWHHWSLDACNPLVLSELAFLGIMLIDNREPSGRNMSGVFNGVSVLTEELEDDLMDEDWADPQRVLIYTNPETDYQIYDMNVPLINRQPQGLKLLVVPSLGDVAMLKWLGSLTLTETADEPDESEILSGDSQSLTMDDYDFGLFTSTTRAIIPKEQAQCRKHLSVMSFQSALLSATLKSRSWLKP